MTIRRSNQFRPGGPIRIAGSLPPAGRARQTCPPARVCPRNPGVAVSRVGHRRPGPPSPERRSRGRCLTSVSPRANQAVREMGARSGQGGGGWPNIPTAKPATTRDSPDHKWLPSVPKLGLGVTTTDTVSTSMATGSGALQTVSPTSSGPVCRTVRWLAPCQCLLLQGLPAIPSGAWVCASFARIGADEQEDIEDYCPLGHEGATNSQMELKAALSLAEAKRLGLSQGVGTLLAGYDYHSVE